MGLSCKLEKTFDFIYKSNLENNLIEHEHDAVFIGQTNKLPNINHNEASDYKYISAKDLKEQIVLYPKISLALLAEHVAYFTSLGL